MRSTLLILALLIPLGLTAQEPAELADYTDDQRWERSSNLSVVIIASWIGYAKEQGQSVDAFADWWADHFAATWGEPGSYGPADVFRGMRRNWLAFNGGTVEVLEYSDSVASGRFNRPYRAVFGEDGMLLGATIDDFEMVFARFNEGVADRHGLELEQKLADDSWVMTFRQP